MPAPLMLWPLPAPGWSDAIAPAYMLSPHRVCGVYLAALSAGAADSELHHQMYGKTPGALCSEACLL